MKYITTLTIAGSDPSSGAGIQADLKTFSALGCYGLTVITALTAQNTQGVKGIHEIPAKFVELQLKTLFSDIHIDAVKIGMIFSKECIQTVVNQLKQFAPKYVILDPVMTAQGGCHLIKKDSLDCLRSDLFPLSDIVTPNIPEAMAITGQSIDSVDDMKTAARSIANYGCKTVLIKGGHLKGTACIDILYFPKHDRFILFESKKIESSHTHGTGCTLSSAIAAYVAKGNSIEQAVMLSKQFIEKAIQSGKYYSLGKGNGPLNHFFK